MASLTFRVATPSDAPTIQPLVQSAYRGDTSRQGWTTEADLLTGTRIDAAGIAAKISAPNSAVLLAYAPENNTLIACCEVLQRSSELAYFGMFAVDPTRQAGGVGRQVLAYAEEYAKSTLGVKKMEMSVIGVRKELIAWYVRRGYKDTGVRGDFPVEEVKGMGGAAVKDWTELAFVILEKEL
ncbi:acyl-CoA N-acyltransferase [Cladorrhinum sp. PSN332]|nr:acyl-CoA N-acyltransferase [Cladorrhinum sp. PSN332]